MIEQLKQVEKQFGQVSDLYTGAHKMFADELKKADIPEDVKKEINEGVLELKHAVANMDAKRAEKAMAKFEMLKKKYL